MRIIGIVVVGIVGCGNDRTSQQPVEKSPLEDSIATDLQKRYGVRLDVYCQRERKSCLARAQPGIELPIRLVDEGSAIDWQIEGLVVAAGTIEAFVREELIVLGSEQSVSCGPRLRRIVAGDRIACELGNGGKAFATFAADGSSTYEIALDPFASHARAEETTDERERELLEMSRQLDVAPPIADGGVPGDATIVTDDEHDE